MSQSHGVQQAVYLSVCNPLSGGTDLLLVFVSVSGAMQLNPVGG